MRRKIYAFLLIAIFSCAIPAYIFASSATIDSLFSNYRQSRGNDRLVNIFHLVNSGDVPYQKVKELADEAEILCNSNPSLVIEYHYIIRGYYYFLTKKKDSALYFLKKAISHKENILDKELLVKAYITLSFVEKKSELSQKWLDTIRALHQKDESIPSGGDYYYAVAVLQRKNYNFLKAKYALRKAISIFHKEKNYNSIAKSYTMLADCEKKLGNIEDAGKSINKAMKLVDKMSMRVKLFFNYVLAGIIDNSEQQKKLYKNSIELCSALGDQEKKVNNLSGLASQYMLENNYDSAIYYFQKCTGLYDSLGNPVNKAICMTNLFSIYNTKGEYLTAEKFADSALSIYSKMGNLYHLSYLQLVKANSFAEQKRFDLAKQYFDKIEPYADTSNIVSFKIQYLDYLTSYYEKKGDLSKAFDTYKRFVSLKDSINTKNNKSKLDELYVKYETQQKEKENIILKSNWEKEKQRKIIAYYFWGVTFLLLLVAVILFLSFRHNVMQKRKLTQEKIIRLQREKELENQRNISLKQEKEIIEAKLQAQKNILESTNLSLLQQSQLSEFLLATLKSLNPYCNPEGKKEIASNIAKLQSISKEKNWRTFEQNFLLLHPNFFTTLEERFPKLTPSEKKICAFMRLGLSTPEMCQITLQTKLSIYRYKKSIREKMGQEDNEKLEAFVKEI